MALLTAALWLTVPGLVAAPAGADLARTNRALQAWLEAHDRDEPFLLLDLQAGQLRYQHGPARLRTCPLAAVAVPPETPVRQRLQARLRRYGAEPFQPRVAGPFDWEQYLVDETDDDGALRFDGGLLLWADESWAVASRGDTTAAGQAPVPAVRLATEDLRALADAVADSVVVVVLPVGWDAVDGAAIAEPAQQPPAEETDR